MVEAKSKTFRRSSDDRSTNSVGGRFSLFGGSRKQEHNEVCVLSQFFDVESVASDTKVITQRVNADALIEKFFGGRSVQTEIKVKRKRKRFSFFRRRRKDVPESVDLGVIFFASRTASCEVPDDDDITSCSGILSTTSSVPEESESESCCRKDNDDGKDDARVDVSIKESSATASPALLPKEIERCVLKRRSSPGYFVDRWSFNTSVCSASPLSAAPHKPRRNPVIVADRWSSNCFVHSNSSIAASLLKPPRRRQLSKGDIQLEGLRPGVDVERNRHPMPRIISMQSPSRKEEYKQAEEDEGEESQSVTSMHSRFAVANKAAATATTATTANVEYGVQRKGVIFDRIMIREYACTVGDNPSCSYGPPITLSWEYIATPVHTVDSYESMKPVKRTKKEFYLPPRRRTDMLLNDWDVSEDDLKWARHEVTCIRRRNIGSRRLVNTRNQVRRQRSMDAFFDDMKKSPSTSEPLKPFPLDFSSSVLTSVDKLNLPNAELVRMSSEPFFLPARAENLVEI